MSEAASESATAVPWELRLAHLLPVPPWFMGALIAAILMAGFVLFRWLTGFSIWAGEDGGVLTGSARITFIISLLVGYGVAGSSYAAVARFRDLQKVGLEDPAVDLDERGIRAHQVAIDELRRSRYAGAAGVLFLVVMTETRNALEGFSPLYPWFHLESDSYTLFLCLPFFWMIGRAAYSNIRSPRLLSMQLEHGFKLDLLNLRPLQALGRIGLRSALYWIIGISLASLAFLNPDLSAKSTVQLAVVIGITSIFAGLALLLPVRGVQRLVRAAKLAELERVNAAIAGDVEALRGTHIARRGEVSLADLIAYKGLVESVREWPFEASILPRFILYLLIPLASWVGGAFVERLLNTALD